jgi:hypothetical protein
MVTTLGISLLSLSQTSKKAMFSLLSLMFSLQQNQRTRGWNRFCLEAGNGGLVAQIMYTHVSKFKNNKIKLKLKNYNHDDS